MGNSAVDSGPVAGSGTNLESDLALSDDESLHAASKTALDTSA